MKRVKAILSAVLGVDEGVISDGTSAENLESWDSFNLLMFVSELENEFKIKFTMDEVISIKSVKDIKGFLTKHGINLRE